MKKGYFLTIIKIVTATLKNLDDLHEMHHETTILHETKLPQIFKPFPKQNKKNYLKSLLKDKNQKVFLAKNNDETPTGLRPGYQFISSFSRPESSCP